MQKIFQKTLEDTMYYRDIPVFIYKINYPYFTTTCSTTSAQYINAYYTNNAKSTEEYCRTVLYPQALESARYIQDTRPFFSYTFNVDFNITYNSGCLTSLFMDTYMYMGGAHGATTRTSNTWNFKTGEQLLLSDFYSSTPYALSNLQKNIANQIDERLIVTPGSYFDDYKTLLKNSFNSKSFYLMPNSLVIYFQQYDIAPYSSGLPEFSIPLRFDKYPRLFSAYYTKAN